MKDTDLPGQRDFTNDINSLIRDGNLKKVKIGEQLAAHLEDSFAGTDGHKVGYLHDMAIGLRDALSRGPKTALIALDVLLHAAKVFTFVCVHFSFRLLSCNCF